jgi:hypothetical protein
MFEKFFKKMILNTSANEILKNGNILNKGIGVSYQFFPKKYYENKCLNDHNLSFYVIRKRGNWKIHVVAI